MIKFFSLVRNFFGFSRSQTNGFIILLPLMMIIILSEPAYHWWIASRKPDYSRNAVALDSLVTLWQESLVKQDTITHDDQAEQFDFNPNQISKDDLIRLGFSQSLSQRIVRYRDKGGKFRIKSDMLKIYGMDSVRYQQLYSYILLPVSLEKVTSPKIETHEVKQKSIARFDINQADTTQLKEIYGIGSKLSKRIVRYRESLGGFVLMDQLQEVWGLDTAVVKRLKERSFVASDYQPAQLDINQATENALSAHPYLSLTVAKAIVAYRFQHGSFAAIEDLRKIQALNISTIQKITPYLKFQN